MHNADFDRGILGANGIVGARIGLGTGAALAEHLNATGAIGISFFGDGAANEGTFHEAMNLAAIWTLPLFFFCGNNQYRLSTPTEMSTAGPSIAARGGAYGVPNARIDGNDLSAIREAVEQAALRARSGEGPTLIQAQLWDFVTLMMDAIVNQATEARYMLGGKGNDPVVFRGPKGAGIRLAAQHTQGLEMFFANVPGLKIYAPASAYDAKGLMASTIRHDEPVVFLEHELLYLGQAQPVPEDRYMIETGSTRPWPGSTRRSLPYPTTTVSSANTCPTPRASSRP